MSEETILTIGISFISLLLIVNAWFTRETLLRVVKIEVQLEKNNTKQFYNEKQLEENTREIRKMRDRLHGLEGGQASLVQYLEDLKENHNGKR